VSLVFKPLGILSGIVAGLVGKKIFELLWSLIDDHARHRQGEAELEGALGDAAVQAD